MSSEEATREILVIDLDELGEVETLAAEHGVEVTKIPPFRGMDAETVALLLVGVAAAIAALGQELERRRGGQVFDLRPGAARPIYRTKDLGYGFVTIFAADGTVRIAQYQPKTIVGELTAALGSLGSDDRQTTVDEVVEAIESVPGANALEIEVAKD